MQFKLILTILYVNEFSFDIISFLGLEKSIKSNKGKANEELAVSLMEYITIKFLATLDDKTLLQLKSQEQILGYIKTIPGWEEKAKEYAKDFKAKLKEKLA